MSRAKTGKGSYITFKSIGRNIIYYLVELRVCLSDIQKRKEKKQEGNGNSHQYLSLH